MKVALTLVLALVSIGAVMAQAPLSSDEQVLGQLREAGSNLSKPHEINYWLYFPDEKAARAAAGALKAKGFSGLSVEEGKKEWRLKAIKVMVPTSKAVAETTALMESIAASNQGDYDGWETQVVE